MSYIYDFVIWIGFCRGLIPVIMDFKNEVGFDNLKETIEANYRKVKQDILSLVDFEIERIKNDPILSNLIKG